MKVVSALVVLLCVLGSANPLACQSLRAKAGHGWFGHELLGSPAGIGVEARMRISSHWEVTAGFDASRDNFTSFGRTCIGLILPNESCPSEVRDEAASVRILRIGAAVPFAEWGGFQFEVAPGVSRVWVESDQVGAESGRRRSASKAYNGFDLGFGAWYSADFRVPLRFGVSARAGLYREAEPNPTITESYFPFESSISLGHIEFGVALGR